MGSLLQVIVLFFCNEQLNCFYLRMIRDVSLHIDFFSHVSNKCPLHLINVRKQSVNYNWWFQDHWSTDHLGTISLWRATFNPTTQLYSRTMYCEIIIIRWTFNFMYLMCRTIYKFNKYLFTLVIFNIIWSPWIQVSTNISIVVKPRNLVPTKFNYFTVYINSKSACPL